MKRELERVYNGGCGSPDTRQDEEHVVSCMDGAFCDLSHTMDHPDLHVCSSLNNVVCETYAPAEVTLGA